MRNKRSFEEQVTTKVIGKEILQNISIATNYQLQLQIVEEERNLLFIIMENKILLRGY